MKKFILTISAGLVSLLSFSQDIDKIINAAEVERIEKILSADDMQGRKTFTPGIDKAADFIAGEFAKSKLQFFGSNKTYFQTDFNVHTSAELIWVVSEVPKNSTPRLAADG